MRSASPPFRSSCGILTALLLALALIACGGSNDGLDDQFPPEPDDIAIVDAFPSLPDFNGALFFAQAPGDSSRAFVVTKPGLIHVFTLSPTVATSSVFLDLRSKIDDSGEQGLLGLAFDPGYAANGRFYVYYNPSGGTRRSRVSRFIVSANRGVADAGGETPLLTFEQPAATTNHKGGWIGFGPDGKLYVASGDGGGSGDPNNHAQNLNSLLGKILRLNPDGTVPTDNPFAGSAGRRGEIWAYGLRNPFRASFDRDGGEFWVADVGQDRREEINLVTRGGNYGWRKYEGSEVYNGSDPVPADATPPLFEYANAGARCSITGGYVYRGSAIAGLGGAYVYGDFCSGEVWALTRRRGQLTSTAIGDMGGQLTSFGEDNAGELYLTSFNGRVYKLVPN